MRYLTPEHQSALDLMIQAINDCQTTTELLDCVVDETLQAKIADVAYDIIEGAIKQTAEAFGCERKIYLLAYGRELRELMARVINDAEENRIYLNVGGTLYPIEGARVDIDGDLIVEATGL